MTHTVTVTTRLRDAGTPDEERQVYRVTFACDAPVDADCRRYPNCECERWNYDESRERDESGHERITGQECSLAGWFENDAAIYAGDDYDDMRDDCIPAIDRSGEISVTWADEWPEWTFTTHPNEPEQ